MNDEHGFDRNASHNADRYVCTCGNPECGNDELRLTPEEVHEILQLEDAKTEIFLLKKLLVTSEDKLKIAINALEYEAEKHPFREAWEALEKIKKV